MRVVSPKNNKECVCVCSGRERVRITKSDTEREREKKIINEGIGTISDMDNTTGRNSNFGEEKKKNIFSFEDDVRDLYQFVQTVVEDRGWHSDDWEHAKTAFQGTGRCF